MRAELNLSCVTCDDWPDYVAAAVASDARSMPTRALGAKTHCVSNIAHIFM